MIHGDLRFDSGALDRRDPTCVVGVLDWELATVGDPRTDLGSALAYRAQADDDPLVRITRRPPRHLPGMLRCAEVVESYLARTGLRSAHWAFDEVFGLFRLAGIAQQIDDRYFHRQTRNPALRNFWLSGERLRRALPRDHPAGAAVAVGRGRSRGSGVARAAVVPASLPPRTATAAGIAHAPPRHSVAEWRRGRLPMNRMAMSSWGSAVVASVAAMAGVPACGNDQGGALDPSASAVRPRDGGVDAAHDGGSDASADQGSSNTPGGNCMAGYTKCRSYCVDLQTNPNNCGACATICSSGNCSGGKCCPSGETNCNGTCTDLTSSAANCGACGHACATGASCDHGSCVCPMGTTVCSGACVNLAIDVANCGACGTACAGSLPCIGGQCRCPTVFSNCDNSCVDTQNDPNHCGACGTVCPAPAHGTATCTSGSCGTTCDPGYVACGTACVQTATDPSNCGACGTVCPASAHGTATCTSGTCGLTCDADATKCGDFCVDLNTDSTHCGSCMNECIMGGECQGGMCVCPMRDGGVCGAP